MEIIRELSFYQPQSRRYSAASPDCVIKCRETSFRLGLPLRLYSFTEPSNSPAHAPYNAAAECNPITGSEGAEGGGEGKVLPADRPRLTGDAEVPGAAEKSLLGLLGGMCLPRDSRDHGPQEERRERAGKPRSPEAPLAAGVLSSGAQWPSAPSLWCSQRKIT